MAAFSGFTFSTISLPSAPPDRFEDLQQVFPVSALRAGRADGTAACLCMVTLNTFQNGLAVAGLQPWREAWATVSMPTPFSKLREKRETGILGSPGPTSSRERSTVGWSWGCS